MLRTEALDYALLISFGDGKALRDVAKKYRVPTGAIRLLNAVLYRDSERKSTSAAQLLKQKTASKTLVRANIAALLKAGLLQRQQGRGPWLRLTLEAHAAGFLYRRQLREVIAPFVRD